jgi:hypothetical protein
MTISFRGGGTLPGREIVVVLSIGSTKKYV